MVLLNRIQVLTAQWRHVVSLDWTGHKLYLRAPAGCSCLYVTQRYIAVTYEQACPLVFKGRLSRGPYLATSYKINKNACFI